MGVMDHSFFYNLQVPGLHMMRSDIPQAQVTVWSQTSCDLRCFPIVLPFLRAISTDMKAVFLDRNTFSPALELPAPEGVSEWVVYEATAGLEDIAARAGDADIVLTNKVVLDAAAIAALPALKLVQVCATGTNNIDHAACAARGIAVQNVAGYSTQTVPEHAWMGILAAMRGLKHYHACVEDGRWQQDGRFTLNDLPVFDVAGRTLVIIGAGSLGQRVAEIAWVFGMHVIFAERRGQTPRDARYTRFEEALAQADVLALHCPLTEETYHVINADTIALMRRKPLLVNMARGAVADGKAVADAVESGALLGYVCDVFAEEPPPPDDPLLRIAAHPRVIFTPHNAWAGESAQRTLWTILCRQVSGFIREYR